MPATEILFVAEKERAYLDEVLTAEDVLGV